MSAAEKKIKNRVIFTLHRLLSHCKTHAEMSEDIKNNPKDEATTVTLRMPVSLRQAIKMRAATEERSESQVVRFYLSRALGIRKSPRTEKLTP